MSAASYVNRHKANVDVYGDHTSKPAVSLVKCPILAILGTNEPTVGTAADLDTIRRNATSAASVQTRLIEGADHVYTGCYQAVADVLAEWVARLG